MNIPARTIPLKRTEHRTVEYLEENEMQALLDAVDVNARTAVRDKALLLLLYNTGARVSEVVGIKIKNLRLQGAVVQVSLMGKGKKHRNCPLWSETAQALQAYLKARNFQDPAVEQLFLNAKGIPVTRFGIRHIQRKCDTSARNQCLSMRPKSVNPRTSRHTTALHLLRAGNDINMVSYWLGHADINTTHIYVEIDMDMKRKMLGKIAAPLVTNDLPWQRPDVLQWLAALTKSTLLYAEKH